MRKLFVLMGFVCLGLFILGCGASATKDPMGFVDRIVKGDIFVKSQGGADFTKITVRTPLFEGDIVKTGDQAEATVLFTTGALTRLLGNTEFEMKQRRVTQTGPLMTTRLQKGITISFVPKDATEAKKLVIETDTAIASIKGTIFKLEVKDSETILTVSEGTVAFKSIKDNSSVDVEAFFQIKATAAGLGAAVKVNVLEDPDLAGAGEPIKGAK